MRRDHLVRLGAAPLLPPSRSEPVHWCTKNGAGNSAVSRFRRRHRDALRKKQRRALWLPGCFPNSGTAAVKPRSPRRGTSRGPVRKNRQNLNKNKAGRALPSLVHCGFACGPHPRQPSRTLPRLGRGPPARRWALSAGGLPQVFSGAPAWIWAAALSRLGESMEYMRKLETLPAICAMQPHTEEQTGAGLGAGPVLGGL